MLLFAPHGNAAPSPLVPAPRICGWVHVGLLKTPPNRHWTPWSPSTASASPSPHHSVSRRLCAEHALLLHLRPHIRGVNNSFRETVQLSWGKKTERIQSSLGKLIKLPNYASPLLGAIWPSLSSAGPRNGTGGPGSSSSHAREERCWSGHPHRLSHSSAFKLEPQTLPFRQVS